MRLSVYRPWQILMAVDSRHMHSGKLVISVYWPPLPPGDIPATYFCLRLSHPQGQRAAKRFKSMNNTGYSIGNQICNHLVCSTMPQPALPPHIPIQSLEHLAILVMLILCLTYLHTYQILLSQIYPVCHSIMTVYIWNFGLHSEMTWLTTWKHSIPFSHCNLQALYVKL